MHKLLKTDDRAFYVFNARRTSICYTDSLAVTRTLIIPPQLSLHHLILLSCPRPPCLTLNVLLTPHNHRTFTAPEPNKSSYAAALLIKSSIIPPHDLHRIQTRPFRGGALMKVVGQVITLLRCQKMEVQDCDWEGRVMSAICNSYEGAEGACHLGDFCFQGRVLARGEHG